MSIAKEPSPEQIMIDHKQLKNVEYFSYLGSMATNDATCTCEIKSRIAMAQAAFNMKKSLFASKFDASLRKKLVKCFIWSTRLYGAENWTVQKVDQKYLGIFLNMVLKKDGEDQLDRSCEK